MKKAKLYFATNRKHKGKDRWKPTGYGIDFSNDGRENLRFGELTVEYDEQEVEKHLTEEFAPTRIGDGEKLTSYLAGASKKANIIAYKDDTAKANAVIDFAKNSSTRMFRNIKEKMMKGCDVLLFIHGYNVSWDDAVATALSLQFMVNSQRGNDDKEVMVVLFSWPSNGSFMPYAAYRSDRADAEESGNSIGRGILKFRDFLGKLKRKSNLKGAKEVEKDEEMCNSKVHLLCHSMGNYVLQNAVVKKLQKNSRGVMPRIFEHIFMCAADVDDDVLKDGKPLSPIHELATNVSVYYNREDLALHISDATKNEADRLGHSGNAYTAQVHNKIHQVDCTPLIKGFTEHSYYLWASVNQDIRQSINGMEFSDGARNRRSNGQNREWTMT